MPFCINCGQQLTDRAKFCAECGAPVNGTNQSVQRKAFYDGEIHKCPNCGEVLNSFVSNCIVCGYEIRGAKNSESIKEFVAKLEEIEETRPLKKSGLKNVFENPNEISATDKKKISLIRSFTIPNAKEDLLEFLILAYSNINMKKYSSLDLVEFEKALSDAWEAKFEQAYEKAKLCFGDTAEFVKIQDIYKKKFFEVKNNKKKKLQKVIVIVLACVLFGVFVFSLPFVIIRSENNKVEKENARLEVIVSEVYDALENKNYVLARAKVASLTFSGPNTAESDKATEKWDKTRNELLAIIDAVEKGKYVDIPNNEEK